MVSLRDLIPKISRHSRDNSYLLSAGEIDASADVLRFWSVMLLRWLAYPGEHRFRMITQKRWPYIRRYQIVGWRSLKEINQQLKTMVYQQQNISNGRNWSWSRVISPSMAVQGHLALGTWWITLRYLQGHDEKAQLSSWRDFLEDTMEYRPNEHPDVKDTELCFFPGDWTRFPCYVLSEEFTTAWHIWNLAVDSINLAWQEAKERRAIRTHLLEWLAWLEETEALAGERMWLFISEPELCPLPTPELPELSIVPPKLHPIEDGLLLQSEEISHYLSALKDVVKWYDEARRTITWTPQNRTE